MKRRSCTHWNYGHYGPIKDCMKKLKCSDKCQHYERRSSGWSRPSEGHISIPKALKNCEHKILEIVGKQIIRSCELGEDMLDTLNRCPNGCPHKIKP